MDNPQQQIIDRIAQATNVLVTVSANPSVDQLTAAIGLSLLLNKLGKQGTAVFSGQLPSTIEFLQPEETIEKTTDSLQDFIIALDKSKADRLRYKVEDSVVKIFITPYRTSISEKDLNFSQGDFNIDAVICLGVEQQQDLDQAIISHGRILHDATVIGINNRTAGTIGSINWQDTAASSLCEMVVVLSDLLANSDKTDKADAGTPKKKLLDEQIATALLTGIVAETDRFRNEKTTPRTMSISAELMSAGANQQLVATKLDEPPPSPAAPPVVESDQPSPGSNDAAPPDDSASQPASENVPAPPDEPPKPDDGTIEISHESESLPAELPSVELPPPATVASPSTPEPVEPEPQAGEINIDENGNFEDLTALSPAASTVESAPPDDQSFSEEIELPSGAPPSPSEPEPDAPPAPGLPEPDDSYLTQGSHFVLDPPALGGTLTSNSQSQAVEPSTDPMSLPNVEPPILSHDGSDDVSANPESPPNLSTLPPAPFDSQPPVLPQSSQTLSGIEQSVHSSHLAPDSAQPPSAPTLDSARDAVMAAMTNSSPPPAIYPEAAPSPDESLPTLNMPLPPTSNLQQPPVTSELPPDAPPPVPPPMMPFPPPGDSQPNG